MTLTLDHLGLTVSDLNRSKRFYREMFDFKEKIGTREVGEGTGIATASGVPGARLKYAFLQLDSALTIELEEFVRPEGKKISKGERYDVGCVHICLQVDDVMKWYTELMAKGVKFVQPPTRSSAGRLVAFCFDPDGYLIQLAEKPRPQ